MGTMMTLTVNAVITNTSAPTMGNFNRYDATAGSLTITLPALSGLNVGSRAVVQKYPLDTSDHTVTFNCAGSDKFDDLTTTLSLTRSGEQRELQVISISGTKQWKIAGSLELVPDTSEETTANDVNIGEVRANIDDVERATSEWFIPVTQFHDLSTISNIGGVWPSMTFANSTVGRLVSFATPATAVKIAIDLVWTVPSTSSGNVKWIGNLYWFDPLLAVDSSSSAAGYQGVVDPVPAAKVAKVSRLGEYDVLPGTTGMNLVFSREGSDAADTCGDTVHLFGLRLTVTDSIPAIVAPSDPLLAGARVRGVNIAIDPTDSSGDSVWANMWEHWDWTGWIKPQLDDAATLGANCVRTFGNTHVITSGTISLDQYIIQWKQFLDYAVTKDLMVYPCGGDLRHWGSATTLTEAVRIYSRLAELLADYDNVIGVDITNEAAASIIGLGGVTYDQPEYWLDTIRRLGDVTRSISGKPITHSQSAPDPVAWEVGPMAKVEAISDFIDLHTYTAVTTTVADNMMTRPWAVGKKLLLGEFGVNNSVSSATRTALYTAVKNFINHDSDFVGGLAWSMYDVGAGSADQYGLYDPSRAPRTDITSVFTTFPLT